MKNAQKPDHVSLGTLLGWLHEGRYVIPDFQREFEWRPWDVRDLVRSIFLDYYIGSLLLWKGKPSSFKALSCQPIYGLEGHGNQQSIVLDGQQRLTAMHYAFFAPERKLPNRNWRALYWIHIDQLISGEDNEAFTYDWDSSLRADPMENQDDLFQRHLFPCALLGKHVTDMFALSNWLQDYAAYWSDRAAVQTGTPHQQLEAAQHAANARKFATSVAEIVSMYQVSYVELDEDLEIDKVCDIFTQLNSRGVRLDIFDLMNALLKPKGIRLKQMWRDAEQRLQFVGSSKMNIYVLQVMSILLQSYCSPKFLYYLLPDQEKTTRGDDGVRRKQVLVTSPDQFVEEWNNAVTALEKSVQVLRQPQEYGVTSSRYLPYASILPAFAALHSYLKDQPSALHFGGYRKIRRWYWASVFTNRYSGSVESTSARDFMDLRDWFSDDHREPDLIKEFKARYRSLPLRRETNSGSSIYNGIFNLLVIAGARDWMTGMIPAHDELDDHHIVPASWGKHLEGNIIHSILNRTPLSADSNRKVIGDRLPNEYLPDLIAQNGETAVRETLESHFISPIAFDILMRNPFTPSDFEAFITERNQTLLDAIEDLLIKERIELPPNLRALDVDVESIELRIRCCIDGALGGDTTHLPQHVLHRVAERLQSEERKHVAVDSQRYQTLAGKLEFCDLRELQDIIVSKPLWPAFQPRFLNKESLVTKFDQLADLRNGLRHSRSISNIMRKEGEAAILWFNSVLSN